MRSCAAAAVALALVAPATAPRLAWPHGRPLRVLFVGDSLTDGGIASDDAHKFRSIVTAGLLKRGPVTPIVRAKGGVGVTYWRPASLPSPVDVAVIELGTNDVGSKGHTNASPTSYFRPAYEKLIASIRARSPRVYLLCVGVWRPDAPRPAAAFDSAIRSMCAGGVFVGIERLARVRANVSPVDGFHPGDAGHAAIARAVLAALGR